MEEVLTAARLCSVTCACFPGSLILRFPSVARVPATPLVASKTALCHFPHVADHVNS